MDLYSDGAYVVVFIAGEANCLVNSDNEQDSSLQNSSPIAFVVVYFFSEGHEECCLTTRRDSGQFPAFRDFNLQSAQ